MALILTSQAVDNNGLIDPRYTCDGLNVNPPLSISGVPENTKSLALIVDDLDAMQGDWVHWVLWNIQPSCTEILENSVPLGAQIGVTDFKEYTYGGPCPPNGKHNYQFKLYALDTIFTSEEIKIVTKQDLELHMEGHIIEMAILNAFYSRV